MDRDHNSASSQDFYQRGDQLPPQTGVILKFYPRTQRADVALTRGFTPNGGYVALRYIPVAKEWAGKNWGPYHGLRKGQLCQVTFDHGQGLGAQITKLLFTDKGEPSPEHPMLKEQGAALAWANFHPVGNDTTAGNSHIETADGISARLVTSREVKETSGVEATRVLGLAYSAPERTLAQADAQLDLAELKLRDIEARTAEIADTSFKLTMTAQTLSTMTAAAQLPPVGTNANMPAPPVDTAQVEQLIGVQQQLSIAITNKSLDASTLTADAGTLLAGAGALTTAAGANLISMFLGDAQALTTVAGAAAVDATAVGG